jgi:hypothetical protein
MNGLRRTFSAPKGKIDAFSGQDIRKAPGIAHQQDVLAASPPEKGTQGDWASLEGVFHHAGLPQSFLYEWAPLHKGLKKIADFLFF